MTRLRISRTVRIPDPLRLERHARAREVGPRILFFSGGTALRETSRALVEYTHNSVHLVTPFDSGGSSAVLRQAFDMMAVGDIRNRLLALADRSVRGNPAVFRLFDHRLPREAEPGERRAILDRMVEGSDPRIREIPEPMRSLVQSHLGFFREAMPSGFDLRRASIGNLFLAGGFLNQGRAIQPMIYLFSRLVEARGTVRPVVERDLHLAAELRDGRVVTGQHRITEAGRRGAPVESLRLCASLEDPGPVEVELDPTCRELIGEAELVCYPVGSFYTSVVANLLPRGVGDAVAARDVPKVFVPNTTADPELEGHDLADQLAVLRRTLRESAREPVDGSLVDYVLVDRERPGYPRAELEAAATAGAELVRCPLVTPSSAPRIDGRKLSEALVSMC